MKNHTIVPELGTLRGAIFLIVVALALALGLALVTPAHAAEAAQPLGGDINGQVTVNGQGTAGLTVELRQRTNGGADALLASATTDANGAYHFKDQPSAPNDAFFYVRFVGSKGTLTNWFSFPIIYISGTDVTVPAVEITDVELVVPAQNASLALPGTLKWKARRMGETYRVFVYAAGKSEKPVLDSGSLGTGTEFILTEGLEAGNYEAIVQVRDAVAGYGQSQARFRFSVGAAAQEVPPAQPGLLDEGAQPDQPAESKTEQSEPAEEAPAAEQPAPTSEGEGDGLGEASAKQPDLKVNLSADKISVGPGGKMVYKLEVENAGEGAALGVVVTDKLPAGVTAEMSGVTSSAGEVSVAEGTVMANLGDLAAGSKATVEIPVTIAPDAGSNVSNQASATYTGATEPVQSNAYIAQVAAPIAGAPQAPPQQPPASEQQSAAASPPQNQASAPQGSSAQAPSAPPKQPDAAPSGSSAAPKAAQPPSKAPATTKQSAPVPQTGGAFPVVFAVFLVLVTLIARYLRGSR